MKISWATVGPFQENSYLVVDETAGRCVLVDPGDEPRRLLRMVEASEATLEGIWITHAHIDHVGAVAGVLRELPVPVWLHEADLPLWRAAPQQAAYYGIEFQQPPEPDQRIADGATLRVGALEFVAMHTPGHAPGHCVLHGHGVALGGDLLFAGSIGRTDLPLADPAAMQRSLDRVLELSDETVVYPGHGPPTTIGEEREHNPFLNGSARVVGAWPR
ncbi:MAG TPA: MBL fold metallo-hydrolase [Gemmatimonadaceae bacterium]|nr:MBL fold metallo-hydrolase [Gemmatimonadaceae bacterium]